MIAYECPRCGYAIDMQSGLTTQSLPGPGDVLVCVSCSAIGLVKPDGKHVRPADAEERMMYLQDDAVVQALHFAYEFQKARRMKT